MVHGWFDDHHLEIGWVSPCYGAYIDDNWHQSQKQEKPYQWPRITEHPNNCQTCQQKVQAKLPPLLGCDWETEKWYIIPK